MLNEQPILIWSAAQNKWISTLIYFTNQPATTTNIKDIDGANDTSSTSVPQTTPSLNPEPNPNSGYQELLPLGTIFPTTETWYTDAGKTKKIVEKNITWHNAVPTVILYKTYAADGITI